MPIRAYAAAGPNARLEAVQLDDTPLGGEDVEIAVEHCGICHSDLSVIGNEWGNAQYPVVGGHEAVGRVVAVGAQVKRLKIGDRVGVGWYASACTACEHCIAGDHHLCAKGRATIIGRPGGFAEKVRCHWVWAQPLPAGVDATTAGPLFCGGITVFSPIASHVRPTDRVAVVGIGGLGHLAVKFLRAWGCEVTALTSSASKHAEARAMGAHEVGSSNDARALKKLAGRFDLILVTVNVPLPWDAMLAALAPRGLLHVVGAVLEPIPVPAFALIGGEKQLSGSPLGRPQRVAQMLEFCGRHAIAPQVERFPMSRINEAFDHLKAGKARYRIVLDADFAA